MPDGGKPRIAALRCDCRTQLNLTMQRVAEAGRGVIVYLRGHEGRGIGLMHKLRAYALQDHGLDKVQANLQLGRAVDERDYSVGANILRHLCVQRVRLMTNNPRKCEALRNLGLAVAREPLLCAPNEENVAYLLAKQRLLGHLLELTT